MLLIISNIPPAHMAEPEPGVESRGPLEVVPQGPMKIARDWETFPIGPRDSLQIAGGVVGLNISWGGHYSKISGGNLNELENGVIATSLYAFFTTSQTKPQLWHAVIASFLIRNAAHKARPSSEDHAWG